ncbi:MAG: thiamine diphosphokinase [Anaerolineales bacterium]|nr:thiamine diphosphokinase [Anaerolineales bacterium]
MRIVIFANSDLTAFSIERARLTEHDTILAADGGARHCRAYNIQPDALIGDFDSLPASILQEYKDEGIPIHRYPTNKDYTDLELTLQFALSLHPREILILGGLGGRWDQSIANLLLSTSPTCADVTVRLIDQSQEVVVLRSGEGYTLHAQSGDTVSLIPIGGDALHVSTSGLRYPLTDETLHFGATRGISNEMLTPSAEITVGEGFLLCVLIYSQSPSQGEQS